MSRRITAGYCSSMQTKLNGARERLASVQQYSRDMRVNPRCSETELTKKLKQMDELLAEARTKIIEADGLLDQVRTTVERRKQIK